MHVQIYIKILPLNKAFVLFFDFRHEANLTQTGITCLMNVLKIFKEAFDSINLRSNRIDSFDMKALVTGCNTFFHFLIHEDFFIAGRKMNTNHK